MADEKAMEFFQKLKTERFASWEKMFDQLAARDGVEIVDLWDGNCPGFDVANGQKMPRLAVYPPHPGKPVGSLIICAGGAHIFKSYNEAMPVADYFYLGLSSQVQRFMKKNFFRSFPSKAFAWTAIQHFCDSLNIFLCYLCK